MTFIEAVTTGLATGLGVGMANYLHEKHIKEKLVRIEESIKKLKS